MTTCYTSSHIRLGDLRAAEDLCDHVVKVSRDSVLLSWASSVGLSLLALIVQSPTMSDTDPESEEVFVS